MSFRPIFKQTHDHLTIKIHIEIDVLQTNIPVELDLDLSQEIAQYNMLIADDKRSMFSLCAMAIRF